MNYIFRENNSNRVYRLKNEISRFFFGVCFLRREEREKEENNLSVEEDLVVIFLIYEKDLIKSR